MKRIFTKNKIILALLIVVIGFTFSFLSILGKQTKEYFVFNRKAVSSSDFRQISNNLDELSLKGENFQTIPGLGGAIADPNNLTDTLISNFAKNIQERNPTGPQPLEDLDQALMVNSNDLDINANLSVYLDEVKEEKEHYAKKIQFATSDDKMAQQEYVKAFAEISKRYFKDSTVGSNDAIDKFLKQKDAELLDKFIFAYQGALDETTALPVPPSLYKVHKEYIESMAGATKALKDIKGMDNDPVRTFNAISLYRDTFLSIDGSLRTYNTLITALLR